MNPFHLGFSARAQTIDKEAGLLSGVSMVTIGPVRGHGVYADQKTLETVKASAETYPGGLRVKFEHGTGAKDIVGVLKDYRIDGQQLRADLHLLKKSPHFAHLLEMSETIPEAFGLSISFSGDREEIEIAGLKVEAARCHEIYSCDVVDSPAANPSGLFQTMQKPKGAAEPVGDSSTGSTNLAAGLTVERWAELQTGFEALIIQATEAVNNLAEMQKQIPQRFAELETKIFAKLETKMGEAFTQLETNFANAELLALKRLGTMGVPAGTIPPTNGSGQTSTAAPKSWSEQLEAIPPANIAERRDFLAKHKAEIYAELEAKRKG